MSIADFCRAVRVHWLTLARHLWPESPTQRQEFDQIRQAAELRKRFQRLLERRRRIERLRDRLRQRERHVVRVAAPLQTRISLGPEANAWQAALFLERLRDAVERLRTRLQTLEAAYERQRQHFEQLRQAWPARTGAFR